MNELPHILLVDDNRGDLELVQEACADAGMAAVFHLARDGHEAVRTLTRLRLQGVVVDLVVLDLLLPGRDGFRVLSFLRHQAGLAAIPVLVLTGSAEMRHVDRAYRLGADYYLYKPVIYDDYHVVAARIAALLDQPPRPSQPLPQAREREDLLWSLHSPSTWTGLGG